VFLPDEGTPREIVEADRPFAVTLPGGPACRLMLRYLVTRPSRTDGTRRYGLNVRIAASREGTPFSLDGTFGIGWDAAPGSARIGVHHAAAHMGLDSEATVVLADVPAGGPLTLRGLVTTSPGTEALALTLFTRPA
jgi:hypothetical protein